jgi:hypothetical protein
LAGVDSLNHIPPISVCRSTDYCKAFLTSAHSLHQSVSQIPFHIEQQCRVCTNPNPILSIISETGVPSEVILSITRAIFHYHHSTRRHIFGLRATMVYPLGQFEYCWMVLEWKESDDTDVLAIYLIDEENEPGVYNWLIHRCRNGATTSTSWMVAGIGDLKRLFEGVQHILGILELPIDDAIKLSSRKGTDTSEEAYSSQYNSANSRITTYIRLVYMHLMKLQCGAAQFDKVGSDLEKISSTKGINVVAHVAYNSVVQGHEGNYRVLWAELQ